MTYYKEVSVFRKKTQIGPFNKTNRFVFLERPFLSGLCFFRNTNPLVSISFSGQIQPKPKSLRTLPICVFKKTQHEKSWRNRRI